MIMRRQEVKKVKYRINTLIPLSLPQSILIIILDKQCPLAITSFINRVMILKEKKHNEKLLEKGRFGAGS